ncbi:MAG: RNA polymerase sigma factor [Candidatus Marinimicrobia bacterium]|nr:RNA polymerase sigma factor [Candidatus Neomarinimicrobiota bacterium]
MNNNIRQLIQLAQAGDSEAFHQLVVLHDEKIMTLAYQLTQNKYDAEDLYQEVFIKAYKSISKFRFQSAFYTWLYRITVNTFYNIKRTQNKMPIQEALDDGSDPIMNITEAPDDSTDRDEVMKAVKAAADQLPDKQRTAFLLKHMQNLKIREISGIMGIGEGTVKKYLFRAMEKLRNELKEYHYA